MFTKPWVSFNLQRFSFDICFGVVEHQVGFVCHLNWLEKTYQRWGILTITHRIHGSGIFTVPTFTTKKAADTNWSVIAIIFVTSQNSGSTKSPQLVPLYLCLSKANKICTVFWYETPIFLLFFVTLLDHPLVFKRHPCAVAWRSPSFTGGALKIDVPLRRANKMSSGVWPRGWVSLCRRCYTSSVRPGSLTVRP